MHLSPLRASAQKILAAATLELFPAVQLVGGEVDEIGFSCDFYFPKMHFSERELNAIEDQMIRLIHENRPIKKVEMMRENAATYLKHLGQVERAQAALDGAHNIISLLQIGDFLDLYAEEEHLASTGELKAFKLQHFSTHDDVVRITGTAFFDKQALKAHIKRCKEAAKRDPLKIGPKEGYFLPLDEDWIYLARGEEVLHKLKDFWDERHKGVKKITFSDALDAKAVHLEVLAQKKWGEVASFSCGRGDLVSIKWSSDQDFFDKLISSLHFIEKGLKIFPFEPRVYCLEPKLGKLSAALKRAALVFESEKSAEGVLRVEFRVTDGYGRERTLAHLEVERKEQVLHRSLFCSFKEWVAHCIELGVEI